MLEERAQSWVADRQLVVHPLRDRMLVTYAGFVALLEDHRLELVEHLWPPEAYELTAIVGDWPQTVVARAELDS